MPFILIRCVVSRVVHAKAAGSGPVLSLDVPTLIDTDSPIEHKGNSL